MTVVDANVWVSAFVQDDAHHAISRRWLEQRVAEGHLLHGPRLLPIEVAGAIVRRTGLPDVAMAAVAQLRRTRYLQLVPVGVRLDALATRLAIELRLRGVDAVYVAVAYDLSVPLVTWDREVIQRASTIITVQSPL